jgi:hypothetical protein
VPGCFWKGGKVPVRLFDHFHFQLTQLSLLRGAEFCHGAAHIAAVFHLQPLDDPLMSDNRAGFYQPHKPLLAHVILSQRFYFLPPPLLPIFRELPPDVSSLLRL